MPCRRQYASKGWSIAANKKIAIKPPRYKVLMAAGSWSSNEGVDVVVGTILVTVEGTILVTVEEKGLASR